MAKRVKREPQRFQVETDPDIDRETEAVRSGRSSSSAPPRANKPKREPEEHDDFRELEEGLRIDEHALEEALRDQPEMFYRVSKALALEISRRDAAKQALQDAEFKADLRVRGQAERQEKKITEGEVRARVHGDDEVVFCREELARLAESAGKLSSLKEAFQQRSYALKDLCGLYIANYYSATENTSGSGVVRERAAADARSRMSEVRREGYGRERG